MNRKYLIVRESGGALPLSSLPYPFSAEAEQQAHSSKRTVFQRDARTSFRSEQLRKLVDCRRALGIDNGTRERPLEGQSPPSASVSILSCIRVKVQRPGSCFALSASCLELPRYFCQPLWDKFHLGRGFSRSTRYTRRYLGAPLVCTLGARARASSS